MHRTYVRVKNLLAMKSGACFSARAHGTTRTHAWVESKRAVSSRPQDELGTMQTARIPAQNLPTAPRDLAWSRLNVPVAAMWQCAHQNMIAYGHVSTSATAPAGDAPCLLPLCALPGGGRTGPIRLYFEQSPQGPRTGVPNSEHNSSAHMRYMMTAPRRCKTGMLTRAQTIRVV